MLSHTSITHDAYSMWRMLWPVLRHVTQTRRGCTEHSRRFEAASRTDMTHDGLQLQHAQVAAGLTLTTGGQGMRRSESPGATFSRALCVCADPTVEGAGLPSLGPATGI